MKIEMDTERESIHIISLVRDLLNQKLRELPEEYLEELVLENEENKKFVRLEKYEKDILTLIKMLEEEDGKLVPEDTLSEKAIEIGIIDGDLARAIEKLMIRGDIFRPKEGFISRT